MSSSELNDLVLNTDRIVRLSQMVLDSRALNATIVGGNTSYDAIDTSYNSEFVTYQGVLTSFATAATQLGGLTASVSAVPDVIVSASSNFGSITGNVSSTVTHLVTLDASNGALSSSISAQITHLASAISDLAGLAASINSLPVVLPLASATLGELGAILSAGVTHQSTASALFGEQIAHADATVIPAPTPEPESQYGAARPYTHPVVPQKQPEPVFAQPEIPKIVESPKTQQVRLPATIVVLTHTNTSTFSSNGHAIVEWSILEDEAELLLLI